MYPDNTRVALEGNLARCLVVETSQTRDERNQRRELRNIKKSCASEYLTAPSQRNQSTSSHCITPEAVLDDTIIPPEGKLEEPKYLPVSVQTF